jgi:hypothetical protein
MSLTPLCAISDQMQRSEKAPLFDHPVGAGELASAHARQAAALVLIAPMIAE